MDVAGVRAVAIAALGQRHAEFQQKKIVQAAVERGEQHKGRLLAGRPARLPSQDFHAAAKQGGRRVHPFAHERFANGHMVVEQFPFFAGNGALVQAFHATTLLGKQKIFKVLPENLRSQTSPGVIYSWPLVSIH